ncbi:coenzyme F420-0:L-glutamate ligase [Fusibacter sp. JL216-2]|uniref:coenzyme F420-0:L-glutamate ligase n=1 Tax=Fusibacter sp. JL216-2 TaxID=3071453 RepID=UPI003D35359A
MARKEKKPEIQYDNKKYLRIPLKTHVVMRDDKLMDVVTKYASDALEEGDLLFVSEKIVAITQGRAIPLKDITPRPLARFLSNHVTKTPAGIGLGMPETMEMALRECGIFRILMAAAGSAITKPFGRKGVFYEIAGYKAQSIDGPTPNTIPPYNQYVVLGPAHPDKVAEEISQTLGCDVAVVDINDIDGVILGVSNKSLDKAKIKGILKDNPLGQDHEQTPMGIIREVNGQ